MYDQPHNSEAGPSNHNGHTNFHTHKPSPLSNIPHISVGAGPSSAPAAIPSLDEDEEEPLDVIPSRAGRKLCVRHKQMANQNVNEKLQKVSPYAPEHLACGCMLIGASPLTTSLRLSGQP